MAEVDRFNEVVISIAQIQTWAQTNGRNSSEKQVREQITKVKALWPSLQAAHLGIVRYCASEKVEYRNDTKKHAKQLYMATLDILNDLLKGHMDIVWADETHTVNHTTGNSALDTAMLNLECHQAPNSPKGNSLSTNGKVHNEACTRNKRDNTYKNTHHTNLA